MTKAHPDISLLTFQASSTSSAPLLEAQRKTLGRAPALYRPHWQHRSLPEHRHFPPLLQASHSPVPGFQCAMALQIRRLSRKPSRILQDLDLCRLSHPLPWDVVFLVSSRGIRLQDGEKM
jgi:hypothetical protein